MTCRPLTNRISGNYPRTYDVFDEEQPAIRSAGDKFLDQPHLLEEVRAFLDPVSAERLGQTRREVRANDWYWSNIHQNLDMIPSSEQSPRSSFRRSLEERILEVRVEREQFYSSNILGCLHPCALQYATFLALLNVALATVFIYKTFNDEEASGKLVGSFFTSFILFLESIASPENVVRAPRRALFGCLYGFLKCALFLGHQVGMMGSSDRREAYHRLLTRQSLNDIL